MNRLNPNIRFLAVIIALVLTAGVSAILGFSRASTAAATSANNLDNPAHEPVTPPAFKQVTTIQALKQSGASESLSQAITPELYRIDRRADGSYEAYNPAQKMRGVFSSTGMQLEPAGDKQTWRWGMRLAGYGYGED